MSALLCYVRAQPAPTDAPLVPLAWDVVPESNRWATLYPLGRDARPDVFFHARLIARASGNPQRAAFVCTGPAGVLARLATQIAADSLPWTQTWATLAALRADGGATATAIKAQWPDERPHVWSGPPAAPVDGGPIGTLVALYARMAGFDSEDAES